MHRLVYYSIALSNCGVSAHRRRMYHWMLSASIRSLRRHNRDIPVHVCVWGDLPRQLRRELCAAAVDVRDMGDYAAALRRELPGAWRTLERYPIPHKWLGLETIGGSTRQVLCADVDTYFRADATALFDTYRDRSWYAREEPLSRRSPLGYSPAHIDEDRLAALARAESARPVAPTNNGVVMMNDGAWRAVFDRRARLLDYTAKCAAGVLAYPSQNDWMYESIAIWLTLGLIDGLTFGEFSAGHVTQGFTEANAGENGPQWILLHYFGSVDGLYRWARRHGDRDLVRSVPARVRLAVHGAGLAVRAGIAPRM